jgi:large subunit ribosomal protein L18
LIIAKSKNKERVGRHRRIRKKVAGNPERPRLSVFRSLNNIYAQVIDDAQGVTLVSASSLEPGIKEQMVNIDGKIPISKLVGQLVAKRAMEKDISTVVFDRGGYKYHGRVKSLADGAREQGLVF